MNGGDAHAKTQLALTRRLKVRVHEYRSRKGVAYAEVPARRLRQS